MKWGRQNKKVESISRRFRRYEGKMREAAIYIDRTFKRLSRCLFSMIAVGVFVLNGTASNAQGVPENLQAAIFYKVLAYDYNIQSKPGSEVTIAVITDGKTAESQQALLDGFNKLAGKKLGGKTIKVIAVKMSGGSLPAAAAASDIFYLPDGSDSKTVSVVLSYAEKDKHATLGGSESLASKGCAIGLTVEGGKPKIVINLPASQAQGMNLSSKVLRLAKVLQ